MLYYVVKILQVKTKNKVIFLDFIHLILKTNIYIEEIFLLNLIYLSNYIISKKLSGC